MKFKINDCGVFINPLKEVVRSDRLVKCIISYASYKGFWHYGYTLELPGGYVGCGGSIYPCSISDNKATSMEACLDLARDKIIKEIERKDNVPQSRIGALNDITERLKKSKDPQLKLF